MARLQSARLVERVAQQLASSALTSAGGDKVLQLGLPPNPATP